ncbi:MAG: PilZ domain-containing protein [Nitrospira sp. LK70]|nr:PilZ domain-containing protein [Nitrospira sp. LK70]
MQTIHPPDLTHDKVRRYPRLRIPVPFGCSLSSLTTRWWCWKPVSDVGVVYDLSLQGACVSTEAAIKPGDKVSLALRLTKGTPPAEVAVATVCWTNHQFHGLAFSTVSQSSLTRLTEYLNTSGIAKE